MNRSSFLKSLLLLPFASNIMKIKDLHAFSQSLGETERMPVLFVGHGNPMNAIEDNVFSQGWAELGKKLPKPIAILCISAHWETKGTFVTAMEKPQTIHDFGGFPQALFDAQYPAPGSKWLANETQQSVKKTLVGLNENWGLDHGCWSILLKMFPLADIPVIQMSLDYSQSPQYHYELAKELAVLRKKGVLILGSGNMVHNLGKIVWRQDMTAPFGLDWAIEANELFKKNINENNHQALIQYEKLGKAVQLAIPTPEHYLPMLYSLALKEEDEKISYFHDIAVAGSLTMTSFTIEKA